MERLFAMARKMTKTRRGRSEGTVTQRSDGRWVAAVSGGFTPDGKRIRKWVSGSSKEEVLRKLDEAKRHLGQRNIAVDTERTTVAEFLTAWLQDIVCHTVRPRTLECYHGVVKRHIIPHIGREQLRRLTPLGLQRLYGCLERDGVGARTRQLVHVTLATALRRARRLHLIDTNPVDGVDAPRVAKSHATGRDPRAEVGGFRSEACDHCRAPHHRRPQGFMTVPEIPNLLEPFYTFRVRFAYGRMSQAHKVWASWSHEWDADLPCNLFPLRRE